MSTANVRRFCVFALLMLGLVSTGFSQVTAHKTSNSDIFLLRNTSGKQVGSITLGRSGKSPLLYEVDFIAYSGPPDVVADQKEDWTTWSRHEHLEEITLRMATINSRLIEYIATLESVKALYCEECDIEPNALQALVKMKGLEEFQFHWLGAKLPISDWSFLSTIEQLQVLEIPGSQVNADFANVLSRLKNLREIRFGVHEEAASEMFLRLSELKKVTKVEMTVIRKQ